MVVTYIPWGVIDDIEPIRVGVSGLQTSASNVSDFTDWTVSMDWSNGSHHFQATSGIGMPFLYFEKDSSDVAEVEVNINSSLGHYSSEEDLINESRWYYNINSLGKTKCLLDHVR